jgi:sorting nexin-1/2
VERQRQEEERKRQAQELEAKEKEREQQKLEKQRQQKESKKEEERASGNDDLNVKEEELEHSVDQQDKPLEGHEDHSRQHSGGDDSISSRDPPQRTFSMNEPNSPNPSFSSLRGRPTPPATSGRSSPSPSIMSGNAVAIPNSITQDIEEGNEQIAASASTSLTETATEVPSGRLDPLVPSEQSRSSSAKPIIENKKQEEAGFFPTALASTSGASSLGIDFAAAERSRGKSSSGDADSDGYGQPSPRDVPPSSSSSAPFTAGYGEVQFGLADGPAADRDLPNEVVKNVEVNLYKKEEVKAFSFQIRVGDPQKVGDPMTAHIMYTVRIKTDCPGFKASQFSVLRRYSDFRWLHAALVHNNAGIFVPPVPEKVKLGRFAPDLVEARRHGLETCINKIANNVRLQNDEDLKLFLESNQFQADVKVRDQIKGPVPTPEQKTYFGWSTSLTGNTYKYFETDEWFDEQRVYLDHLETHLKNLVKVISNLSQQRKDMAGAISDFSHAIMMLSGSSLSRSLSTCFAGLGEVQRRTFELADIQADADVREFASVIYEYERMVGSARKAFSTRIDAWQAWQKYEDESKKMKVKHEKLKRETQGNHRLHDGRLSSMLDEVVAVDTRCLNQKREFDLIGLRCKEEMSRFEWDRIKAFEEACEVWLQGMIERNEELMEEWEQYAALLERQTGEKVAVE